MFRAVKVAAVTFNVTSGLVRPFKLAVIIVDPTATGVARPILPAVLLIVAVAGVAEVQVAAEETLIVVLSDKTPIAVNCCVTPFGVDKLGAVTGLIETKTAGDTTKSAVPLTPFKLAEMLV